jgi:hypothetical protein
MLQAQGLYNAHQDTIFHPLPGRRRDYRLGVNATCIPGDY